MNNDDLTWDDPEFNGLAQAEGMQQADGYLDVSTHSDPAERLDDSTHIRLCKHCNAHHRHLLKHRQGQPIYICTVCEAMR